MSTLNSARLYARIALLRRRVLLRQTLRQVIAGALAVVALVVAAGLATFALYLAIRVSLGELGATLAIAAGYAVIALGLLIYAFHDPSSPELEALAEMEAAALDVVAADTRGVTDFVEATGERLESLGSSVALGVGMLSALRRLLAKRKA